MPSKTPKSPSNYEVIKEVGKHVLEGVKMTGSFFYLSPTFTRRYNVKNGRAEYGNGDVGESVIGAFWGSVTHDFIVHIYNYFLFGKDMESWPKEALFMYGMPILTHLSSGIYEYIRYTKKKMAGTLSVPSTGSGGASSPAGSGSPTAPSSGSRSSGKLEEKVEKDEIKIKDIPNPWDIDIPKIEDQKIRGRY